jgi:hypothetical protein
VIVLMNLRLRANRRRKGGVNFSLKCLIVNLLRDIVNRWGVGQIAQCGLYWWR